MLPSRRPAPLACAIAVALLGSWAAGAPAAEVELVVTPAPLRVPVAEASPGTGPIRVAVVAPGRGTDAPAARALAKAMRAAGIHAARVEEETFSAEAAGDALALFGPGRAPAVLERGAVRVALVAADSASGAASAIAAAPEGAVPVLLARAAPREAAAWLRAAGRGGLVLTLGRARAPGGAVRVGEGRWLASVPRARSALQLKLVLGAGVDLVTVSALAVPLPSEISPAARAAVSAGSRPAVAELHEPKTATEPAAGTGAGAGNEAKPQTRPGKAPLTARNRAVALRVHHAAVRPAYGRIAGRALVLDTEWENVLPPKVAFEKKLPFSFKLRDLREHLYVVVNGRRLVRVTRSAGKLRGHLPSRGFHIPDIGLTLRGNVVFEVPETEDALRSAELRFYDFAHGHFRLSLLGAPPGAPEEPASGGRNEILELGVFGLARKDTFAGKDTPFGLRWLQVDLRGRGLVEQEVDASAFGVTDGRETVTVRALTDYTKIAENVQLVVDGELAYAPHAKSPLAEDPRFLPDLMTGGDLVFQVPSRTRSLELWCHFPEARIPNVGRVRPVAFGIPLEGKRPEPPAVDPLVTLEEPPFRVEVLSGRLAETVAASTAGRGAKFLVLRYRVTNTSDATEIFRPHGQLEVVPAGGRTVPRSNRTWLLPHHPPQRLLVPPGGARAFELAFAIPREPLALAARYRGFKSAPEAALPLDALGEGAPLPEGPTSPVGGVGATAGGAAAGATPDTTPETGAAGAAELPAPAPAIDDAEAIAYLAPKRTPKGLAGVGLTAREVNEAIDRGAAALETLLDGQVKWSKDLVCVLAIIHADRFRPDSPLGRSALDFMYSFPLGDEGGRSSTYVAGVIAMALSSLDPATHRERIADCARFLAETQETTGTWGYGGEVGFSVPPRVRAGDVASGLHVQGGRPIQGVVEPLAPLEIAIEGLRTTASGGGDNSCAQFGVLGLWAAGLAGVRVPRAVWERAFTYFLAVQGSHGGWGYTGPSGPYGSMTNAGLGSLRIAAGQLGREADPEVRARMGRGARWIAEHFDVARNPLKRDWHHYALYGLERTGTVLDLAFFGPNEWYPVGARHLVRSQQDDGLWVTKTDRDPKLDTAFALLFLERATDRIQRREVPALGGDGLLVTRAQPADLVYVVLDCSASMNQRRGGRYKQDVARDSLLQLARALPGGTRFALRAYGHRYVISDRRADGDTELLIPPGPLDAAALEQRLRHMRCKGKTPIAAALSAAAGDIRKEEGQVSVLLLSDGRPTDRKGAPARAAGQVAARPNVKLHAVGFDVATDEVANEAMTAIARAGRGRFVRAPEVQSLAGALETALGLDGSFRLLNGAGQPVATGRLGEERRVPEGLYTIEVTVFGRTVTKELWINTGATTTVDLAER
jgi:Mg-chelatase subunit ChlD